MEETKINLKHNFSAENIRKHTKKLYVLLLCLFILYIFSSIKIGELVRHFQEGTITKNMIRSQNLYRVLIIYTKYATKLIQVNISWILCALFYYTVKSFRSKDDEVKDIGKESIRISLIFDSFIVFITRGLTIAFSIQNIIVNSMNLVSDKLHTNNRKINLKFIVIPIIVSILVATGNYYIRVISESSSYMSIICLVAMIIINVSYYVFLIYFSFAFLVNLIEYDGINLKFKSKRMMLCVIKGSFLFGCTLGLSLPKTIETMKMILLEDLVSTTDNVQIKIIDHLQGENEEKKVTNKTLKINIIKSFFTLGYFFPNIISNILDLYFSNIQVQIFDNREQKVLDGFSGEYNENIVSETL